MYLVQLNETNNAKLSIGILRAATFSKAFFVIKKNGRSFIMLTIDQYGLYNPRISKMHLSFYIATNACTYICKKKKEDIDGIIRIGIIKRGG